MGMVVNLGMAVLPVALGYGLGWGLSGKGKQRRLPLWLCIPIVLVWLALLPSTCYLLTEWRRLLLDPWWADLLDISRTDPNAMLRTAKWALVFLTYAGTGVLLFTLAVRPVAQWLRAARRWLLCAVPLFFVVALGVYFTHIVRLDAWDLVRRPRYIGQVAMDALTSPTMLLSIGVFALFLWLLYEAVDVWVEGIAERLRRRSILKGGAPAKRK